MAPRLSNAAQQDMQPQSQTPQMASSLIPQPNSTLPSNADVVQAINSMSAQVTNQLSVMGTQLASLVSLTSRLIEISQMTLAANDSNARTANAPSSSTLAPATLGTQTLRQDASPATSNVDLNRTRVNGAQTSSFGLNNMVTNPPTNAPRTETRQGAFYPNASNTSSFRTTLDPVGSTLDRTFGSTLRGASPPTNTTMNNSLSAAAGRATQLSSQQQQQQQQQQPQPQHQQQQVPQQQQHHLQPQQHTMQQPSSAQQQQQQPADATHDANDLLKSRLPSPVFPDDPLDMSTDVSPPDHQASANAKRLSTAAQGVADSARKATADTSLGDWKAWLNRTWHAPPGYQSRPIKYRTMQAARRAHRDQTKRSMATLGRLPLKEFLEIRPEQYLSVRKTGRKLYQEWLLQEVRLAKQPEDRVKATINRLEHDHPELGDCEDHWKSRQLLQQIIDNAIDEANLHRKKEARASHVPNESTPRTTMDRSTSMLGLSASSSSSALADADRSLRGSDMSISSLRKATGGGAGNGAAASKNAKAANRRKADQAELDDTPTRFRQAPNQRASMLGPGGSDENNTSSLQTQQGSLSSAGLEAAHSGRSTTLADYSGGYNNDSSTIASTTSSDAMQASRHHAPHNQHMQHTQQTQAQTQQHHTAHQAAQQQDHTHNAWASQTAAPGASLFGQSNYANTATHQALSHHQQYGHHGHHHNSNYLSSDPGQTGLSASSSGLLDDQRHQSHLSPLVNSGNVRMHQPGAPTHHQQQHQQQQPANNFFDGRGYQ